MPIIKTVSRVTMNALMWPGDILFTSDSPINSQAGEHNNLANKYPEKVKKMAAVWEKWNSELAEPAWGPAPAGPILRQPLLVESLATGR